VATSGPGATNLLTGLATAFMDCVPLVALTGQVARAAIGTQAFQEVDIVGMVGPITKGAFQLQSAADIPRVFAEAFRLAGEGRPGPVLIDFPKDVQLSSVEVDADVFELAPQWVEPELSPVARLALKQVAALLETAERPVVVAGHGVAMAGAVAELLRFAEASGVPVGTTLLGLGVFPEQHPQALGMVGMHGTVQANLAMHHADLVIGIGMRFDDRVVGRPNDFAPGARIVHVDVDSQAFGRVVRADVPVLADARVALHELAGSSQRHERTAWWARLYQWTGDHEVCGMIDTDSAPPDEPPTTPEVVRALRRVMGGAATVVSDIGQHQMFVALHHGFDRPGQMLTSGGLGTMGYGLPAAMGVKTAQPGRAVWAVVGDGGFQMSAPELSTLVAANLPVKVLIVNNKCLGMVRQWQELFYDHVYSHSMLPQPNFEALARAHGCWATTVRRRDELEGALREAALHPGPAVVDVHVPIEETVYPMVPAGSVPGDVRCVDAVDASAS
jgi:acetolactate synthase-1/2/3 large subunit